MPDSIIDPKARLRQKIVGLRIRHARTDAGLTLKEVGQILGVSAAIVSEMEFGQRETSLPQLEIMALFFNVPVNYFWSEDPLEGAGRDLPTIAAMGLRQRMIGGKLRQIRTEAGRTPEDLGNLLGVPASQIAQYELGEIEIPLSKLEALANYLNESIDSFIEPSPFDQRNGHLTLDELAQFSELPKEMRDFLANPANHLYINIAMRLSDLSAETLRSLAEGLLEVTY
jgi:transcriptional regulator with XRE-family HTH domain